MTYERTRVDKTTPSTATWIVEIVVINGTISLEATAITATSTTRRALLKRKEISASLVSDELSH